MHHSYCRVRLDIRLQRLDSLSDSKATGVDVLWWWFESHSIKSTSQNSRSKGFWTFWSKGHLCSIRGRSSTSSSRGTGCISGGVSVGASSAIVLVF
ncbi:hypothetical protein AVEN_241978-1 [Araneus ventricosus]|uniref:Uncharacterized protein n=1 Tax=Araneus ventricosus TaxID=182803 RepID=A0A4Y2ECY4_ARAVE|nr:hypothetical protein AVEN_241978-1 [Araneus ventricosus]